ncbi:hypothetical protein HZS_6268, partial [Henneguya salminicola]
EEKLETKVFTVYSRMRPVKYYDQIYNEDNKKYLTPDQKLDWPKGTYGILSPIEGCPNTNKTKWKTGWVYQNTENDNNENNSSEILHAKIRVTEYGITQHFCIKDIEEGENIWQKGSFCLYQYGSYCPQDFHSGYVYWDDENDNNKNIHDGYLPNGNYGPDTEIRFCCRSDGDIDKEIDLPFEHPFCLFPKNIPSCQRVKNMQHILEYIKFDDEDTLNKNTQAG